MIAAVGNRVEGEGAEKGSGGGSLALPDDLKAGQWRWLTAGDLAACSLAGSKIAGAFDALKT